MGVAMEAMIKTCPPRRRGISVTTIIISRSEKPPARSAPWVSDRWVTRPIDVLFITPPGAYIATETVATYAPPAGETQLYAQQSSEEGLGAFAGRMALVQLQILLSE
jgi:hypothetical protein